jgi:hypothetical protein
VEAPTARCLVIDALDDMLERFDDKPWRPAQTLAAQEQPR